MKNYVAVNQLNPKSNMPEENFARLVKTIIQNVSSGAQLAVFPEDFLYGVLRIRSELLSAAEKFGYWTDQLRKTAKKYQVDIVPGTMPMLKDGKLYNAAVYIDKSGEILTTYTKSNLWLAEREEYSASSTLPKVVTGVLGKTAVIICWDIFDHTLFRSVVRQGVKWIIIVSFWSTNQSESMKKQRGEVKYDYDPRLDSHALDVLIKSRVVEYNVGIIFVNFAGTSVYESKEGLDKAVSANRSQVVSPFLITHGRLSNRKEEALICGIQDISQDINNNEIYYGRREDIVANLPIH